MEMLGDGMGAVSMCSACAFFTPSGSQQPIMTVSHENAPHVHTMVNDEAQDFNIVTCPGSHQKEDSRCQSNENCTRETSQDKRSWRAGEST
jgi:hypothetical protein